MTTLTVKSLDRGILKKTLEGVGEFLHKAEVIATASDEGTKQLASYTTKASLTDRDFAVSPNGTFTKYLTDGEGGTEVVFHIQGVLAAFDLLPILRRSNFQGDVTVVLRKKYQSIELVAPMTDTAFRDALVAIRSVHAFMQDDIPGLKDMDVLTMEDYFSLRLEKKLFVKGKDASTSEMHKLPKRLDTQDCMSACRRKDWLYTEDNHVEVFVVASEGLDGMTTSVGSATDLALGDIVDVSVCLRVNGNKFAIALNDITLLGKEGSELVKTIKKEMSMRPPQAARKSWGSTAPSKLNPSAIAFTPMATD